MEEMQHTNDADQHGSDNVKTYQTVGGQEDTNDQPNRRSRAPRMFPALSFREALFLGESIQSLGAEKPIRRLTLFEALQRSPESATGRSLVTSSAQYGITTGSYTAEFLELTEVGAKATSPDTPKHEKTRAQFDLAIAHIAPFNTIYETYKNSRLPSVEVLRDAARGTGVRDDLANECVETFLANSRELGLMRTIAGSEHLITIEATIEQVDEPTTAHVEEGVDVLVSVETGSTGSLPTPKSRPDSRSVGKTCFVISPIGAPDSLERKHADLVLSALIEPALVDLGLDVIRADHISKPGMITGQVMEYIASADLVIADLSFANPNVYYELALRHAVRNRPCN